MKFFRTLLPIAVAACGLTMSTAAVATCKPSGETPILLREFVNSKRTIPLEEKSCNLVIAADIRSRWAHITERQECQRLRGRNGVARDRNGVPYSTNEFDVDFNLYFDYTCERAWGVVWLNFDNIAGIEQSVRTIREDPEGAFGSGCCDGICLKKAYMGYNFWADGCSRFDVEIGRHPMYTMVESYIEYRSRFDGIWFKYAQKVPCWADLYLNVGAFVIDERVNHFGYLGEFGAVNIADSGFTFKYSYIDWKNKSRNRAGTSNPRGLQYQVSQVVLDYAVDPDWTCIPITLLSGYLWNSAARKVPQTFDRKQNTGWYLGALINQVCHEGDWALEIVYVDVGALAVPGFDIYAVGRGNVLGDTFTTGTVAANARDNTNFRGWRFDSLYALTDNFSLEATLEFSRARQRRIGGQHSYSLFQIEAIYAF